MTNSDYRRLNNVYDSLQATRELRGLVESGLLQMHGTRRWAYYTLEDDEAKPRIAAAEPQVLLRNQEQAILNYLRSHDFITNEICREILGLGDNGKRATYLLGKLVTRGLIRLQGKKRWARYVLA